MNAPTLSFWTHRFESKYTPKITILDQELKVDGNALIAPPPPPKRRGQSPKNQKRSCRSLNPADHRTRATGEFYFGTFGENSIGVDDNKLLAASASGSTCWAESRLATGKELFGGAREKLRCIGLYLSGARIVANIWGLARINFDYKPLHLERGFPGSVCCLSAESFSQIKTNLWQLAVERPHSSLQ